MVLEKVMPTDLVKVGHRSSFCKECNICSIARDLIPPFVLSELPKKLKKSEAQVKIWGGGGGRRGAQGSKMLNALSLFFHL